MGRLAPPVGRENRIEERQLGTIRFCEIRLFLRRGQLLGGVVIMSEIYGSRRPFVIILVLIFLLLFASATSVFAAATWSNISGPNWNGSAWVLDGTVTLRSPHHYACMHVTVPDGPNAGTFNLVCPASGTAGTHTFTCTLAASSVSGATSSIPWYLFADSNSSCAEGNTTLGTPNVNGSIDPTGPTAIVLAGAETLVSGTGSQLIVPLALLVVLSAASLLLLKRRAGTGQNEGQVTQ